MCLFLFQKSIFQNLFICIISTSKQVFSARTIILHIQSSQLSMLVTLFLFVPYDNIKQYNYKLKICKSKTTPKNSSKLPTPSAPKAKASQPLINHLAQFRKNSKEQDSKTQLKIEGNTERCCSLLKEQKNTSQESSCRKKLPNNPQLRESSSSNTSRAKELSQESKLIKDLESLETEKKRTSPKELKLCQLWQLSSINWAADSPNGEQFSKLQMAAPATKPSPKMQSDLPNMPSSANKMVSCPSQNLKFYPMDLTQRKTAKKLHRRFSVQFLENFIFTRFCWKDVFLNLTWSLMDHSTPKRRRTTLLRKLSEQFELFQELYHLL